MLSKIFTDYHKLSLGTTAEEVNDFGEFIHMSGMLDDCWFNYIVPKVGKLSEKSRGIANKIIETEKSSGVSVSWSINIDLDHDYRELLEKEGFKDFGSDTYMVKSLKGDEVVNLSNKYELKEDYEYEKYSRLLINCQSEWENEAIYCQMYENYLKTGQNNREFFTYVINEKNDIISAASLVLDKTVDLGYFHNDGTDKNHRRKGLHKELINKRCLTSFENSISRALAIVVSDSGSYWSYKKAGFIEEDRFTLFGK